VAVLPYQGPKTNQELSEIIMKINDLREFQHSVARKKGPAQPAFIFFIAILVEFT